MLALALAATARPAWAQQEDAEGQEAPETISPAAAKLLAACGRAQGQLSLPAQGIALPAYLARGFASPPPRPSRAIGDLQKTLQATPQQDPRRADALWDLGLAYLSQADGMAEPARVAGMEQTIKTLAILVRDHPQYQRRDHALLLLGRVLMERDALRPAGQRGEGAQQARRVFHELIRTHPSSPYVPHVYTQFGDYFFDEGETDSAIQFYERAAQFPGPASPVYGYVQYRLATSLLNVQERVRAANRFAALIRYTDANPGSPDAAELGRRARLEICLAR